MTTTHPTPSTIGFRQPINLASREFADNKHAIYRWLREEAPLYRGKITVLRVYFVSRYADCLLVLRDPRFVRNRRTAKGRSRLPIPMPKSFEALSKSMIIEDEPEHGRLRGLVQQAFTPRAIRQLEGRIERLTHELLDRAEHEAGSHGSVDLIASYTLPIPVTVIREMVGVSEQDMPRFRDGLRILTEGFSGWALLRTFAWDLRKTIRFARELIAAKREHPADDILSGLIQAEQDGDRLSEGELVSMFFLLVFAGYETTVHLIANGVLGLLEHPSQLDRLRADPSLMGSAVEEILRYAGPIHGTKLNYATEDVELAGSTLPRGAPVMPLLGAANRDPEVFEDPETFDITRSPNRHLGFGYGLHVCLGAVLARMETRVALTTLLDRCPELRLAVPADELEVQRVPGWHRYQRLPVHLH